MRRTILTALALIVTLGFTAEASAKNAADLKGTTWVTASKESEGKTKITMMMLQDDGTFIMGTDVDGERSRTAGTYRIVGNQIQIVVDGESFTMNVTAFEDDLLFTSGGNSGTIAWIKYRK